MSGVTGVTGGAATAYGAGMRALYREAGDSIHGVHDALLDAQNWGAALIVPYRARLDEVEAAFRAALDARDLQAVVDAWNAYTDLCGQLLAGYGGVGAALLEAASSATATPARATVDAAVERAAGA